MARSYAPRPGLLGGAHAGRGRTCVANRRLPLPQREVDPEELTLCGYAVQLDNSDLRLEAAHIGWFQFGGSDTTRQRHGRVRVCLNLHSWLAANWGVAYSTVQ